jgi:phosphatidylglycerophosphate synthase
MASATRELTFLLAAPEKRLLQAIARRVPGSLRPNHFTVLGVLAATGAGAAYALASHGAGWLWLASAMLAVQWFGDSLDGTLARVRRTERPRYGYYLDHITDAYSTAAIGVGIGLSHYVHFSLALGLVVLYLLLSINVYLETQVFGTFQLGYGRLGPTEARLMLVAANTVLALSVEVPAEWPALFTVRSGVVALLLVGMLALIVARFARNVRVLARLEPQDLSLASRAARGGAAPRVSVGPTPSPE